MVVVLVIDDVFSSSVDEASPPTEDEAPAAAEDEAPPPAEDEASAAVEDEAPAAAEDEASAAAEDEASAAAEDEASAAAEDEAPAAAEDEAPPPADGGDQLTSGGGGGGGAVDLDSALGSLTAFLDTRERLSNPELELMGIETFALSPITSSSGLKGILLDVIGPYDNIVTQYRYQQNTSSNYTYVNEVTPDYPWICSAVLFILLLVSVFRLIGRCFSWMK